MKLAKRPCPDCGEPTTWDDQHHPNAWRHDDSVSRWCTRQSADQGHLNYPSGCLQGPASPK